MVDRMYPSYSKDFYEQIDDEVKNMKKKSSGSDKEFRDFVNMKKREYESERGCEVILSYTSQGDCVFIDEKGKDVAFVSRTFKHISLKSH